MSAVITGLLDLLQWLAGTFANFASWLVNTIRAIAEWVIRLVEYPLIWLWNAFIDALTWGLTFIFWLLGHLLELPLGFLTAFVQLLPNVPPELLYAADHYVIPAYNVANQILPLSEALAIASVWAVFYGVMALWRAVTFIRGGR